MRAFYLSALPLVCALSVPASAQLLNQKAIPAAILHEGWPAWTDAGYPTRGGDQP